MSEYFLLSSVFELVVVFTNKLVAFEELNVRPMKKAILNA